MSEKISIEQFIEQTGYKRKTIIKNKDKIPGLKYIDGEFIIKKGTRYPYNIGANKLEDSEDRRYCLLDAINKYKYIDYRILRFDQKQFKKMLEDFLNAGLIEENHLGNNFGANAYDCTNKGIAVMKQHRNEAIKDITDIIASATGHFTGAVISEVYSYK